MAGIDNLKPPQSTEEARERGRVGGIKSGEARRAKRTLRECLEILLDKEYKTDDGETLGGAELISLKQLERAMIGDTKAFEVIRDTIGQKPVERVEITEWDTKIAGEIEAYVDGRKA